MELILIILAALVPVVVALGYIMNKDKEQPEPAKWLLRAFVFGVISVFLSFLFSTPASVLLGMEMDLESYSSIAEAFADAFMLAAIPEELAKLIMLWLLLRNNPFYDEKFDGIVYAVFIGMGFAALENVMYLIGGIEDGSWAATGVARALFSVPGHFFFAVLMGYYYSLYHFGIDRSVKTLALILVAPIVAHGLYDGILFCVHVNKNLAIIGVFIFLFFFNRLRKKGNERIDDLEGS